jgi:DNA-binding LytR/AlgR family response regulator
MTYQIAICDDEEKQRAYIKSLVEGWLRQTFHHTKIQEYASSEQFLFEQAYDRTQILFLDIEMEKMDGIALAREIRKHNRQMQIIFVTGYMEYIQEGYDVEALHVPSHKDDLHLAVVFSDFSGKRDAVHFLHLDIKEQNLRPVICLFK